MKITEAKPIEPFRVFLRFDDGVSGVVDLGHFAGRGVFRAWEQPGLFERLSISPEGALQWPGDLDLCPDSLYLQLVGKSPAEDGSIRELWISEALSRRDDAARYYGV